MNFRATARTLALALPLVLSGCIEMEQDLTIGADGAGTMKSHVGMNERMLEQMQDPAIWIVPEGGFNRADVFDEKRTRDDARKKGIDLQAYKTWAKDEKKHVEMVIGFKNPRELRNANLDGTDASDLFILKGEKEGTARMVLYPQGMKKHEEQTGYTKAMAATDEEGVESQRRMHGQMKAQFKGLKITYRCTVPGKIVSVGRGLQQVNDTTAAFTFADEDLKGPEDLARLLTMKFEIVFEARGLQIPFDKEEKPASRKSKSGEDEDPVKEPAGKEKSGDK
jgi:hypothetical protein